MAYDSGNFIVNSTSTIAIPPGYSLNGTLSAIAWNSAGIESYKEALDELIKINLAAALTSPIELTRTRAEEIHKEIEKRAAIEKIKKKLSEEELEILGIK